ncbi:hypothetical protein FGB62_113g19 [Gracilaria domingensis]|nr:hypothetical protein FGB62_113g19 [Gracilaria domingensis]
MCVPTCVNCKRWVGEMWGWKGAVQRNGTEGERVLECGKEAEKGCEWERKRCGRGGWAGGAGRASKVVDCERSGRGRRCVVEGESGFGGLRG